MKKIYILYLIVSVLFGLFYYWLVREWIYSVLLGFIFLIFFTFFFENRRSNFEKTIIKSHEAINFINNFIISLSVTNSLNTAFTNATNNAAEPLKDRIESIEHLTIEDRIEYLYNYFNLEIYGVFINIVKQYVFNGGDIIKISQLLLRDSRQLEERIRDYKVSISAKMTDFLISWVLTFVVLLSMNLALKNISTDLTKFAFYPALIFVFFIIFIFNLMLVSQKQYDDSFIAKGEIRNEKK